MSSDDESMQSESINDNQLTKRDYKNTFQQGK